MRGLETNQTQVQTIQRVTYTHQIPPCLFFIILSLQLVDLKEPLEAEQMSRVTNMCTPRTSDQLTSDVRPR